MIAPHTMVLLFGWNGRIAHKRGEWVNLHSWRDREWWDALPDNTVVSKATTSCGRTIYAFRKNGHSEELGKAMRWELLNHDLVRPCERCSW